MQVKSLTTDLVKACSAISRAKRDTVLTTLLVASGEPEVEQHCLEIIDQGMARVDEELISGLYSVGDRKAKLALACSLAASRMTPRTFRKIFDDVYGRSDLTVPERRKLAWNLEVFLNLNPPQFAAYERTILDLLKSPRHELRLRALALVGRMDRLAPGTLDLLARNLKSRNPSLRVNALQGFYELIERFDEVDLHVRDFVASNVFREQVTQLRRSDPDENVRHNANSVLRVLGRAGGPSQGGSRASRRRS